jgi:hypothetical protein
MEEIWKDIPGFENLYQVSSLGRVKSLPKHTNNQFSNKEIILKPVKSNNYLNVNLKGKIIGIHRLVAITFIPNEENKPQINHKDGNKQNNIISNLEWCTASENILHAYKTGLKVATSNHLKKKILQYDKRGNFIKEWESTKEIERKLKIYHSAISNCCKNKKHYNSAGGFVWKYKYE